MTSKRELSSNIPRERIIKIPEPIDKIARLNNRLDQEPDNFMQVTNRYFDSATGNIVLHATLTPESPEIMGNLLREFVVKPFNPDENTASYNDIGMKVLSHDDKTIKVEIVIEHPDKNRMAKHTQPRTPENGGGRSR